MQMFRLAGIAAVVGATLASLRCLAPPVLAAPGIAAIAYELHGQTRRVYRCEADEFA